MVLNAMVPPRIPYALLLTLGFASVASAPLQTYSRFTAHPWIVVFSILAVFLFAGFRALHQDITTRLAASAALLIWSGCSIYSLPHEPSRGLAFMLAVVFITAYIWPAPSLHPATEPHHPTTAYEEDTLLASLVAIVIGIDQWKIASDASLIKVIALSASFLVPALASIKLVKQSRSPQKRLSLSVLVFLAAVTSLIPLLLHPELGLVPQLDIGPAGLLSPFSIAAMVGWHLAFRWFSPQSLHYSIQSRHDPYSHDQTPSARLAPTSISGRNLLDVVLKNPTRVLVISFLFVCIVGTGLLHLPLSSASDQPLTWMEAAFTAVSATCVTGLTVIDPGTQLSSFGQVVLLSLIQIGGIGMMVFSSAAILLLGGRLSITSERVAMDMVGATARSNLRDAMRTVMLVTIITEAAAAILLYIGYLFEGENPVTSIWKAFFTAISAFCNAGFALSPDSLVSYNTNPFIVNVVGLTIIIAGMGPPVVVAGLFWRDQGRRTLHSRVVLLATALLVLIPALLILALEWNYGLAGLSTLDKISNGLFQSVTLRTAGFNSVDLTQLRPMTWTLMEIVMFIGGSPGSTSGGVKTTTVAIILVAIITVVRGDTRIKLFGRTIPNQVLLRATAIVTFVFAFFCFALIAIQLTQTLSLEQAVFEVISAIGTVGVSLNVTGQLDELGRVIIMACMFAGRVGPLSLFVFFASGDSKSDLTRFPEEALPVG